MKADEIDRQEATIFWSCLLLKAFHQNDFTKMILLKIKEILRWPHDEQAHTLSGSPFLSPHSLPTLLLQTNHQNSDSLKCGQFDGRVG